MALFAGAILRELNEKLSALHGSDNATYGTPDQGTRRAGDSLDDRLNACSERARKLVEKGKRTEVLATLDVWRTKPIRPQVFGTIPNLDAELAAMDATFDAIVAGEAELGDPPPHDESQPAPEIRYYSVKKALERHRRWSLIIDDITSRAGL